jgi:hypothetical protein
MSNKIYLTKNQTGFMRPFCHAGDVRKSGILFALLLCGLLSFLAYEFWRSREPECRGHDLSYWLSHLEQRGSYNSVRQIGTNAVPLLLEWMNARDTPWKTRVITFFKAHPEIPIRIESAEEKNSKAYAGLLILGPAAKPAVAGVLAHFQRMKDADLEKTYDANVLRAIGPDTHDALPTLVKWLRTHEFFHGGTRGAVLGAVNSIDPEVLPNYYKPRK